MAEMRTAMILILTLLYSAFSTAPATAQTAVTAKPSPAEIESLIQHHQLDRAETFAKARILAYPYDAQAIVLLGNIREQQRLYRQAESVYREALRVSPTSAEATEALAKLYSSEGRIPEAVAITEPLYRADRLNIEAKVLLSSLYEKRGRFAESLSTAESLLTTPDSRKVLAVVITDRLMLGQAEQAQPLIAELLQNATSDSQPVADLARALMRNGMITDASELLKIAAAKLRPTASLLAAAAESEGRQGHLPEAKALAEGARQLDPDSFEASIVSAQIATRQADWKSAAIFFRHALAIAPPHISALQGLAYAEMQNGEVDSAQTAAQFLYDLQPDSTDAALSLALVDVRAKHWGEADPLLDKVLAARPHDKPAHLAKGIAKYNLQDLDAALQHLKTSLGQGQPDGEAHYYLGLVGKQRGDLVLATKEMESAIAADPSHQLALSSLGQLYAQEGKLEQARTVLERAIEKIPEDPQSHYQLATVYRRLAMADKAREQLEIYQRLITKSVPVNSTNPK